MRKTLSMNGVNMTKAQLIKENQQLRSELEQIHAELKQANNRYHELYKNSQDVLFIVDPAKGEIVEVNNQVEAMLGFMPDELKGRPMTDLHPDETEKLNAFFSNIMQKGYGKTDELTGLTKSGKKRCADISAFLIEEGKNKLAIANVRDITERKRIEESLRKNEQYNRMLFQESTIGLALCRLNGDLIDINPAYASILGRTVKETLKLSYWEITPEKYAAEEQLQLESLEKNCRYGPYEKEYIHADGHFVPVRLSGQIIEKDDEKFIWSSVEDITVRKQVEEALRASEERLRLLVDQADFHLWSVDNNLKFTQSSGGGLEQLALKPNEVVGLDLYQFFQTDSSEFLPIKAHLQALTGSHIAYETEWQGRHFQTQLSPQKDNQGNVIGCIGVAIDITERKLTERALKRSEERFRQLAENINEVFWLGSPDWQKIFYVSSAYEKKWGQNSEELYRNPRIWIEAVHPDDREQVIDDIPKDIDSIGEYVDFREYRIQKPDGQIRWVKAKAYPILDHDGNVIRIAGIAEDITERVDAGEALRNSEAWLAEAQRVAHFGSWILDLTSGKPDWSEEEYRLLGYEPRSVEATPENFISRIHPDDKDYVSKELERPFQEKNKEYKAEFRIVLPGKGIRWVSERGRLFYDGQEKPQRYIGTTLDITERKEQEEQLRRSQKMDALGKLTGGISHDYNNLLGIIQGYSEQLREHLTHEPKLAKYAHDIQRAAERGSRLTKKLLAFSRQKTPDVTALNLNTLLKDEQHMLEKTLTARIKLTFDLADDLWPVELDSGDLEDAVVNLSINAMHAMESGGELTLNTSNEQLDEAEAQRLHLKLGDYVLLSITDTGCGMDEVTKENIFDPFFTTKGERGTGLGLSQVYGFVERSGGSIMVYSEPGHGSRFALYFPRSYKFDTEIQATTPLETQNLRGTETLLVVDDEQAMVELAYDILTAKGYRVLTANDGEQALQLIEKEAIDLVVTDVIMPIIDGYQLATKLQKNYPHIKIQIVSGFADSKYSNMVDLMLHKNILHKPYTSNTLLTRVRNLLDEGSSNARTEIKLKGRTILVMDDEEETRELFKLNLNKLGCKAIPASTGEEAIALYQQSLGKADSIDVAILDLSIPGGLGGKDVAEKIRALDPQAKIIVASGHSDGPEMTNYQNHGFDGALEKNFNREIIKQVLEQVLSSS